MRWVKKERPVVSPGDTRTVTRFLLFPKTLRRADNALETRWLEWARVYQRAHRDLDEVIWLDDGWIGVGREYREAVK